MILSWTWWVVVRVVVRVVVVDCSVNRRMVDGGWRMADGVP